MCRGTKAHTFHLGYNDVTFPWDRIKEDTVVSQIVINRVDCIFVVELYKQEIIQLPPFSCSSNPRYMHEI